MDNPAPTDLPTQSTARTTAMHHAIQANDTPNARIAWAEQCMAERRHIAHIPAPQPLARLSLCTNAGRTDRVEAELRA